MAIVNIWLFLVYEKVWFDAKRLMILLIFQYLTLWLSFAFIYRTIFLNYPDSFIGIQSEGIWTWLYYSMTVLTTLGSNVMPCRNSILAQSIVMIEVVLGILYVVWFLGATISQVRLNQKEA